MIVKMIVFAVLPIVTTAAILSLEKKAPFKRLGCWGRQVFTGVIFGFIACLAIVFSVRIGGSDIDVCNAAPMTAGLVFGAPAGVIAGVIGAIGRSFSRVWDVSEYTRLAGTISTLLSGVIGAVGYKLFMGRSKRFSWIYGVVISTIGEVMHMQLVFFTNPEDPVRIFYVFEKIALPMFAVSTISVAVSLMVPWVFQHDFVQEKKQKKSVSDAFQLGLLACISAGVMIAAVVTYSIHTTVETKWAYNYMDLTEQKFAQVMGMEENRLLAIHVLDCAKLYPLRSLEWFNESLAIDIELETEEFSEKPCLFVINSEGRCIDTSDSQRVAVGKVVDSAFLDLVNTTPIYVENESNGVYISEFDEERQERYVATRISSGDVFCAIYKKGSIRNIFRYALKDYASAQAIGETGYMLLISDGKIISNGYGSVSRDATRRYNVGDYSAVKEIGIDPSLRQFPVGEYVVRSMYGVKSFCYRTHYTGVFGELDGLFVFPVAEMELSRNATVYTSVLMQVLVFALTFVMTYLISKRVVIDKINRINASLTKIAAGDLGEDVQVREYVEFDSLSSDINATVDTMKRYIDEANSRIDSDLAFAKEIQEAVLPGRFPPYPNRKDFDIFASMTAAKTVGGDFYDLYLLDEHHLVFLIADVSGKSIPGAMFMMRSKTIIKDMTEKKMSVEEVFSAANSYLVEGNRAKMFVTCWMGIADLRTGVLSFANAGHNPPMIRHGNGQFEPLKRKSNFVLAGKKNMKYQRHEIQLLPGDELFLYTDGVTEARDTRGEQFGGHRLVQALNENPNQHVEERCRGIQKTLDDFVGEGGQFDDITMLSVCFNSFVKDDYMVTVTKRQSVETVWEFIERKMRQEAIGQWYAQKVLIIVDELYSNILRHSDAQKAKISVSVVDRRVGIEIEYNGNIYVPKEESDSAVPLGAEEYKGDGLERFLVRSMASSVSHRFEDGWNILSIVVDCIIKEF